MPLQKSVYECVFASSKFHGENKKVINVVAVDFNEAMKKATDATKVKDFELVKVELLCAIDVE